MLLALGSLARWTAVLEWLRSASTCPAGMTCRWRIGSSHGSIAGSPSPTMAIALCREQWLGAAKGIDDVVLLTLGTGVGGGVILGGQLFLVAAVRGGPGLIGLDPAGPPCNSGNNGSIETFCSIGALTLGRLSPDELSRRAQSGDAEALRLGGGMASCWAAASAHWCMPSPQSGCCWGRSERCLSLFCRQPAAGGGAPRAGPEPSGSGDCTRQPGQWRWPLGRRRLALSVCQAARDDAWQSPCPGVESGRSRSLPELLARASSLRRHAIDLAQCSDQQRQDALRAMADALEQQRQVILAANQADLQAAEQEQLAPALLSRLKLDGAKLDGAIAGIRQLAQLPDPLPSVKCTGPWMRGLFSSASACPLVLWG